jgi:hypothetical protein
MSGCHGCHANSAVFWDAMPSSLADIQALQGKTAASIIYLIMEAADSRAALVDVHQTTQHHYTNSNFTDTFNKTIKNLGFTSTAHVSHQKRQ